ASGFVGRYLVPYLLEQGREVLAWGGPHWRPLLFHRRLETRAMDLGGESGPLHDVGRLDAVIWLAQGPGYKDFPKLAPSMVAVNLLGLTRTLDLAQRAGARSFTYASTGNVYAASFEPMNEEAPVFPCDLYSHTKLAGEELVKLYRP